MIAEAAVNFSRALDLAETLQDWFVAGMAARNLSDMSQSGFDYAQSLEKARAHYYTTRSRSKICQRP